MRHSHDSIHALRADGVALIVDTAGRVPRVLHWGADPGDLTADDAAALRLSAAPAVLNNAPDIPRDCTVWPSEADGWSGTPAQRGHARGTATTPRVELVSVEPSSTAEGDALTLVLHDPVTAMRIAQRFCLDPSGVLSIDVELTRDGTVGPAEVPYTLDGVLALLPLPERAAERLDFTGKWCRERAPQRAPLDFGTHSRRSRRGKPGHDSAFLLMVGEPGFGFGHGEVWAAHPAWSGDVEFLAERLPEAAGVHASVLGVGEALHPGEVILADGESYRAPTAVFVWSDRGMDGLADRLHRRLRARAGHPRSPRPLVLNTWEAVYFDHDLTKLLALVDVAAKVGVERVVLDDGWFRGRRAADAGLGDWEVDPDVWPDGLDPLVDAIRDRGMEFGLWFEPEMVNLDSDLARQHPDWVLGPRQGLGPTARNQYVLDLTRPDAYAQVLERISTLVTRYDIDYIKWDHNRDLLEPVSHTSSGDRPAGHGQTLALYRMLDELHARHPRLEIESCSGGGGRVDLGVLEHTQRVWASDCNDPVERLQIERWTRLLVAPELIGSHLGDTVAHTTGRRTDLSFRLAVSLLSHAGIEMDLTRADVDDLRILTRWADLYKRLRGLAHTGRVVNADLADDAAVLQGVVAADSAHAVYLWARLATSPEGQVGRVRLPGLDPSRRYEVRVLDDLGPAGRHQAADPDWVARAVDTPVACAGALLTTVGLPLPTLNPQQAMLLEVRAV